MENITKDYFTLTERKTNSNKYTAIIELSLYCTELDIPHQLKEYQDGYILLFDAIKEEEYHDVAQHDGTYGSHHNCVEFAIGCDEDFSATELKDAKKIIYDNRIRLGGRD